MTKVTPISVLVSVVIGLSLAGVIYLLAFQPTSEPMELTGPAPAGMLDAIIVELENLR